MAKNWLSITEAAEASNLSRQTIWRLCGKDGHEKEFQTAQQIGTTWMIEKSEVIRYAEYYHSTEFDDENVEAE